MSDEELLFLAYRYLAGELSPDECAAFEDRLAASQMAREALAQASQLAESVQLACEADVAAPSAIGSASAHRPAPVTHLRRRWLERVGWMATGAAAIALAYFAIRPRGAESPPAADPAATALAIFWAQQPSAVSLESADDDWPGEPFNGDGLALGANGVDGPEVIQIPPWMLAAVSAAQGSPDGAGLNATPSPERLD